jgi:hypothetical protein
MLILIFSAIFCYCMTRQEIVKKSRLTTPEKAKKKVPMSNFIRPLEIGKVVQLYNKNSYCYDTATTSRRLFSREHVVLTRLLYPLCCSCCSFCLIITHGIRKTNWYSKNQLVFEVPLRSCSTKWYSS